MFVFFLFTDSQFSFQLSLKINCLSRMPTTAPYLRNAARQDVSCHRWKATRVYWFIIINVYVILRKSAAYLVTPGRKKLYNNRMLRAGKLSPTLSEVCGTFLFDVDIFIVQTDSTNWISNRQDLARAININPFRLSSFNGTSYNERKQDLDIDLCVVEILRS